jgi:dipeptidyl aminopeptidase/acylaminoacyl peptidase
LTEAFELINPLRKDKRVKNIFINGYSSGGHLSLMLLEYKPTFFKGGILAYPVVTSDPKFSHAGSFQRLLGGELPQKLMEKLSLEKHVPKKMPPIFLWHTMEDTSVPVENSLLLLKALRKKNIPVETHFFPKGRHGLSLATIATPFLGEDPETFAKENEHVAQWFPMAINWLKTL